LPILGQLVWFCYFTHRSKAKYAEPHHAQ
jgi:hypothetical protein